MESVFYTAWAGGSSGDAVGGMRRDKGTSEELSGQQREVVMDWQDERFCVKMGSAGHLHTTRGSAKGTILQSLKFGYS